MVTAGQATVEIYVDGDQGGHAFGNFVARAVAADHPGMVSTVILAAASGQGIPPRSTRPRSGLAT